MTSADPPAESRDGIARRATLLSVGWLALVAAYSLLLLAIDAMHFEPQVDWALIGLTAVAWIAIVLTYVRGLARASTRRSYGLSHLGTPLLIAAPLVVIPADTSWLPLIILLTAYILELRNLTAGQGFLFSLGLVAFVIVLATAVMSFVESEDPESSLDDVGASAGWTLATLFRLRAPFGDPQTEDGKILSLVVGICALLAASLFTAQLVTWVTGSGRDKERKSDPSAEILAEIAALRAAVEKLTNERLHPGDAALEDSTTPEGTRLQEPPPN